MDFEGIAAAAAVKSLQSCPTLCDPRDGNPPGSPVPGILQARTLEWVAISFSNAWKWKVKGKSVSRVWPLAWTAVHQAPLSMGFSRQEYCSGVPWPSPNYITSRKKMQSGTAGGGKTWQKTLRFTSIFRIVSKTKRLNAILTRSGVRSCPLVQLLKHC